MDVNWQIVAQIASPIIALFIGIAINRYLESRPILQSFIGHISNFKYHPPSGTEAIDIYTHSVVLRNVGRKNATNVRLTHHILPDFDIWPTVIYRIEEIPDNKKDIVIPQLVRNEQIIISYLYFYPHTLDNIHGGIKCDQGFAKPIPVLLQRQYPRWVNRIAWGVLLIGLIAVIYLIVLGVRMML